MWSHELRESISAWIWVNCVPQSRRADLCRDSETLVTGVEIKGTQALSRAQQTPQRLLCKLVCPSDRGDPQQEDPFPLAWGERSPHSPNLRVNIYKREVQGVGCSFRNICDSMLVKWKAAFILDIPWWITIMAHKTKSPLGHDHTAEQDSH